MNLEYHPQEILYDFKKCNQCNSELSCQCGEHNNIHEWSWDTSFQSSTLRLDESNLEVKFYPGFSLGTAAIRGNKNMDNGRHHYWEIKMVTPPYGTDVMVGVGTKKADLSSLGTFCSLLGRDSESWGYSYKGYLQHNGQIKGYGASFKEGSLVGIHLDLWRGTLQFFLNRKPLGIAFIGLKGLELYPMVSSTAAESKMRIIYSCSTPASLQMECLSILRPVQRAYLSAAFPGLKYLSQSVFAEILQKHKDEDDEDYEFPNKHLMLDEFDFALIGCKKAKKRKVLNPEYVSEILPTNLKTLVVDSS